MIHTTQSIREAIDKNKKRHVSDGVRKGITDILVAGTTWREAAIRNGVTESGLLRAMQRLGLRQGKPK